MENYNTTNVKDLPSVDQILDGDFLIVENPNGTSKIDFKDFVIGPNNTSFYTPLANDVLALSGDVIENDTLVRSLCNTTTTSIANISAVVDSAVQLFSPSNVFYSNKLADINANTVPVTGRAQFVVPASLSLNTGNVTVNYEGGGDYSNPLLGRDASFIFYTTSISNTDGTNTFNVYVSSNMVKSYARTYGIAVFGFISAPSPVN